MKTGYSRAKKYSKKLVGDVSQLRLLRYGDTQKSSFKSSVGEQVNLERLVKTIIGGSSPTMYFHFYMNFGKKVAQLVKKFKGQNLLRELEILDRIWLSRGLNLELLNRIKHQLVNIYPLVVVCRFDVCRFDVGTFG